MPRIDAALSSLDRRCATVPGDAGTGTIDPRAGLVTTLAFIAVVTSYGAYDVLGLLPLAVYPVSLMALGNHPFRPIGMRLILVCPFAVLIGIFNPVFDRQVLLQVGSVGVSGGWVSFFTIMVKFVLTVSAALILVTGHGFDSVCHALERLKVPRVFVSQLLLMHRYIHVMAHEASRMVRAHALRSAGTRMPVKVFGSLAGSLLLRTLDRAQRIHTAMVSRGFTGNVMTMHRLQARPRDGVFILVWCAFFVLARMYNLPLILGETVMEILP